MAEKTEKATPKKLRDARNKGQVAKSQDLPSAFTFIASICLVLMLSSYLYNYLAGFLVSTFQLVSSKTLVTMLPQVFIHSVWVIFVASMPIMGLVAILGVMVNFLIVGPVFTFEVFKPDIKKFNPVQNIKSKFKLKTLFELLKSLVKVFVACYLIYDVMYKSLPTVIKTISMPMSSAALVFSSFLLEVVIKVGLFFIIIAIADFVFQRRDFAKEMKMEKFEVKQEYKNTEGDPQIKGKRRQLAQEIAYQEGPSSSIRRAQAVVTNPTHLAIAVGYERDVDAAPYILAMGDGELAERMIKIANEYNIPVVRNISLAHTLWDQGEIFEFVPESTYETIAEILRWVSSLQTDSRYDLDENNT